MDMDDGTKAVGWTHESEYGNAPQGNVRIRIFYDRVLYRAELYVDTDVIRVYMDTWDDINKVWLGQWSLTKHEVDRLDLFWSYIGSVPPSATPPLEAYANWRMEQVL